MSEPIDCRSEDGITIGLIDAMITIARIAAKRDLKPKAVQEALLDFYNDDDMLKLRIEAHIVEERIARES